MADGHHFVGFWTLRVSGRTAYFSAAVFFEEFFYFEGGHAAGAGGGDGLAVAAVLDVAAGEDAGDVAAVDGWGRRCRWVRM